MSGNCPTGNLCLRFGGIDNRFASPQSRRRRMNTFQIFLPRRLVLLGFSLVALFVLTTRSGAANEVIPETAPPNGSNDTLRASLELQEQLHASQLALKQNREERESLEKELTTRLKALEEGVKAKSSTELDSMKARVDSLRKDLDDNNRLLLYVGGGIAGIGFFVLLATGYLQWRSVNRLAEFSALIQSARTALPAPSVSVGEGNLLGAGTTAQSNGRMFGALTDLEKRIAELEHTAHVTPGAKVLTTGTGTSGTETDLIAGENGHEHGSHETVLLAKGQSLLNMDKPSEALACFEEILKTEPNHGEALVKKGLALEELNQPDEALRCYDRAIEANADLTIAYLQKGGLFNRLERYEEALQCYELALRAQEKAHQA